MTTVNDAGPHTRSVKLVTTPETVDHPLAPLTAAEIETARVVLADAGRLTETTRFPQVLPVEPDKRQVAGWRPGDPIDRRIAFTLLDTASGDAYEAVVSVTRREVDSYERLRTGEHPYGQPQYLFEEYDRAQEIAKASPEWQAAMRRRGVTDFGLAFAAPLAPGFFGREDETGRRVIRSLTFMRNDADDSPWAHPVEGLIVHIDLTAGEVIRVEDDGDVPIPEATGNYREADADSLRTTLKPLEIIQPEGPSFTVDGSHVQWENWKFRVGFNAREGLVLNQVSFTDGGEDRPVLYRASIPEMVVPYGDTASNRFWISYFDAGEYLLGKNANALSLGCDCLGVIHYFDAFVADDRGNPVKVPQAVCMHEEDYGVLWKHTDLEGHPEVRRSRRLVVSFIATVGNYDYGFYWYFYLDGTIEVEAKATGIVFTGGAHPGGATRHAPEVAPGVIAPVHQHLFCARLDVSIDGDANAVSELEVHGIPIGPENPHGNAFEQVATPLKRESDAQRVSDSSVNRQWRVENPSRLNHVGRPTAYHLIPQTGPTLMAQPGSSVAARAAFATKHLWVTRFDPSERFPAGDYPNQNAGDGLPVWTAADREIENTDIVLWHTFGPTHIPRTEDWPIMPVDYSGFLFKPQGFLDRNPTLDLPSSAGGSCDHGCHCD